MSIFLLTAVSGSYGCEICGCGNNQFQIGILPNFKKGFLGYRYTASRFSSQVRNEATQFSHDQYRSMEIWGGYNFNKLQVMAFAPYIFSRKETDDGLVISNGMGDLMLLVNYKIFDLSSLSKNEEVTVQNQLFVGGGIKLPTGINKVDPNDPAFNIGDFNSQAGTGSTDYILNITHYLMCNKSGLVTNIAYRINTANKQDYRFGNRTYVNTAWYYTFTLADLKIKPSVGINYQSNAINKFQGSTVDDSNGYIFNSTAGLNLLYNNLGLNSTVFVPTKQNMYDGQTKLQSRIILGLTYSF
jgi:hypothetical protein